MAAGWEGNLEGKWALTSRSGGDVICFGAPETWIISKPETEQMDFLKIANLLFDDADRCKLNSHGKCFKVLLGLEFTVMSVSLGSSLLWFLITGACLKGLKHLDDKSMWKGLWNLPIKISSNCQFVALILKGYWAGDWGRWGRPESSFPSQGWVISLLSANLHLLNIQNNSGLNQVIQWKLK